MGNKIVIFSIAIFLIFILGLVAHLQYFHTRDHIIELYGEKQSTLALQATSSLQAFISERIKALEVLADMLSTHDVHEHRILREFRRTFDKIKGFSYIIYLDTVGNAQWGYPSGFPCPSEQNENIHVRFREALDHAIRARETEIFSKRVFIQGGVFICLITPLYTAEGESRGAVLGVLEVKNFLQSALTPIVHGKNDYIWILSKDGFLLYHPIHEEMLLREISIDDETCLECHKNFDLERDMMQSQSGAGVKSNLNTPRQIIGYAKLSLENTEWSIAVSSPFHPVTRAIRDQFMNTLLLVLFMMAIVTLSALMINRATMRNISATKEIENLKTQAALIDEKNAAESRYRILVEQSPDPIFLTTRRKMLMINQSFEKLFGYQQHEVSAHGFSFFQLVDGASVDKFQNELEAFVKQRLGHSSVAVTMKNKSGEPLEVEISLVRFLLGRRVVYQGIIHDITRTKLLERERERKKHLALIGEMAARFAHEIKNPLASIQTGIQLLESQTSTNDRQKIYYERLRAEIQRVDSILKGLLSYAREDYLNAKSIAIAPVIRRFQDLIGPTIQKHDLGFEVSIDEDLPHVSIDEQKIEQVLWNICLNAIQVSREGNQIYLTIQKNGAGIDLKIRDEGSGIPENQMNKIFTPFYSTRVHGSGLGLAISKKIVELHDGHIRVESEPGTGTTVIIHLPENRAL